MKRKYKYYVDEVSVEKEYSYIPFRYILALLITLWEVCMVIGIVIALCYYVPYFYILAHITSFACVLKIVSSDDNPDYKVPWLLVVLILPVAGFMLYFLFYSRKLKKKYYKRLNELKKYSYSNEDKVLLEEIEKENIIAKGQAKVLVKTSNGHLFNNTKQTYFPLGEQMYESLLKDLKNAKTFIYMEYFIIEEGKFWNSILSILKEKVKNGVDVKVIYDDIGCISTLPGNYDKELKKYGIEATPFSKLKGNADSEFNNRNHRKITVIDGIIGYTGGINIADEYINEIEKHGHWKDTAIRLEGKGVYELTKLFLNDFGLNIKKTPKISYNIYPEIDIRENGYLIPFGDGPVPLYKRKVGKIVIQNMLNVATKYMYITTPYLIIDNDLCQSIENAALRGVDVRIIVPHIPDKKLVFQATQSFYKRLMDAGVRIYEYTPGFIHAKSYICDDKYGMIGTINMDYRSLFHHFENGVWMYNCDCLRDIKEDIDKTILKSTEITNEMLKVSLKTRIVRAVIRVFAPLL